MISRGRAWRVALLMMVGICVAGSAMSHEVRPAFLQITELPNKRYDILWKQPTMGAMAVRLVPHISGGLLEQSPSAIEAAPSFHLRLWRDIDAGSTGLEGRTLHVEGLERTITDVMVSIKLLNGESVQHVLRPQSPGMTLRLQKSGLGVPAYLKLGVEHILTGVDHLLFVLGLLLLVRNRKSLIVTVTAFTVAHSITLAATTLGMIAVRPALIEALVALSILFVAIELVHSYRGSTGLTVRYPWVIAFAFGLLHGSAFAGALAEIGLPEEAMALSLFLFNVGVELGQLLFIGAVLVLGWMLSRLPGALPGWVRWVPPYGIGSLAAFWFLDRLATALA